MLDCIETKEFEYKSQISELSCYWMIVPSSEVHNTEGEEQVEGK